MYTWNILSAEILSAMFLNILSAMDWYLPIFYPGIGVYVNILSASPSRYNIFQFILHAALMKIARDAKRMFESFRQ